MLVPRGVARLAEERKSNDSFVNLDLCKLALPFMQAYLDGSHAYHATMPTMRLARVSRLRCGSRKYLLCVSLVARLNQGAEWSWRRRACDG